MAIFPSPSWCTHLRISAAQLLVPHRFAAEEQELARQFANDLYNSARAGKVVRNTLLAGTSLLLIWQDKLGPGFFDLSARTFEPHLRGPMAYFMGLRYLHVHKQPGKAADCFASAMRGAADYERILKASPNRMLLRTLTQQQLTSLQKK